MQAKKRHRDVAEELVGCRGGHVRAVPSCEVHLAFPGNDGSMRPFPGNRRNGYHLITPNGRTPSTTSYHH
jgi:hypothetical protein